MLKQRFPAVITLRIVGQHHTGQRDIQVSTLYTIALQLDMHSRALFPDVGA